MINDRIEALIEHFCNGNKSLFAQKIGVRPSVIGNITGERKGNPSFEVVQKILNAFASINPDWLILDKGSMLRSFDDNTSPSTESIITSAQHDALSMRLLDKLDQRDLIIKEKDDQICACQNELRLLTEKFLTIQAKLSQYESSPHIRDKEKEITADLCAAGNAYSDVSSQKPSSPIKKVESVTAR